MISKATISFLSDLKENNDRNWFEENKARYQDAKKEFDGFIGELLSELGKIEPGIGELTPGKVTFRIYRDVRFSKNKDPYKTNFGAYMAPGGRKSPLCGFYLHIEPSGSFLGGGVYHPEAAILKAIRQEIDYESGKFHKIIEHPDFKKAFGGLWENEKLKRAPKGYAEDHPDIELLKLKNYIASHQIPDSKLSSKKLLDYLMDKYEKLQPLNNFLNEVIRAEAEL